MKIIEKRVMLMALIERVKTKIKELIAVKGMTIYELAQKAELTEACIRNWYTKRNYTPSLEAIEKICIALEIPVSELVRQPNEELLSVSFNEKLLIRNWRMLDSKERELILMQMNIFLGK